MTFSDFVSAQFPEKSVFDRKQFDWVTNLVKWLALHFSYLLYRTGISANALDVVGLFIALAGFFLLLKAQSGYLGSSILGILLIYLHVFIDFADGPIAKAKNQKSLMGALFDDLGCELDRILLWTVMGIYTGNTYVILANVFVGGIFLFFLPQSRRGLPDSGFIGLLKKVYVHKYSFLSVRFMLVVLPLLIVFLAFFGNDLILLAWSLSISYMIAAAVWLFACIPYREGVSVGVQR
jgi:phosphatidylglycerophosphate synthase